MRPSLHPSGAIRPRRLLGSLAVTLALLTPAALQAAEASASATEPGEIQFMRDIAPILSQRCFSCHGAKDPEGELRLDTFEGMTKGDHPAVVPGHPEDSGMIHRIKEEDSSSRMPRDDDPLTPAQIALLTRWIQAGAKFDGPDPKAPYAPSPAPGSTPNTSAPHHVHPSGAEPAKDTK